MTPKEQAAVDEYLAHVNKVISEALEGFIGQRNDAKLHQGLRDKLAGIVADMAEGEIEEHLKFDIVEDEGLTVVPRDVFTAYVVVLMKLGLAWDASEGTPEEINEREEILFEYNGAQFGIRMEGGKPAVTVTPPMPADFMEIEVQIGGSDGDRECSSE